MLRVFTGKDVVILLLLALAFGLVAVVYADGAIGPLIAATLAVAVLLVLGWIAEAPGLFTLAAAGGSWLAVAVLFRMLASVATFSARSL